MCQGKQTHAPVKHLIPIRSQRQIGKPKYMDAEEQFLQGACIFRIFPIVVSSRHSRGSSKDCKDTPRHFDAANTLQHLVSTKQLQYW